MNSAPHYKPYGLCENYPAISSAGRHRNIESEEDLYWMSMRFIYTVIEFTQGRHLNLINNMWVRGLNIYTASSAPM